MSTCATWKMSLRRTARARSVISSSGIPTAQAAATSEPMLLPTTRPGVSPRSSRALSTPMCASPLRPPPLRTSVKGPLRAITFIHGSGVPKRTPEAGGWKRVGYDIAGLRAAEFPWAGQTNYLDHASIGPLPERTRQAGERFLHRRARPFELTHEDMFGGFAAARAAA